MTRRGCARHYQHTERNRSGNTNFTAPFRFNQSLCHSSFSRTCLLDDVVFLLWMKANEVSVSELSVCSYSPQVSCWMANALITFLHFDRRSRTKYFFAKSSRVICVFGNNFSWIFAANVTFITFMMCHSIWRTAVQNLFRFFSISNAQDNKWPVGSVNCGKSIIKLHIYLRKSAAHTER